MLGPVISHIMREFFIDLFLNNKLLSVSSTNIVVAKYFPGELSTSDLLQDFYTSADSRHRVVCTTRLHKAGREVAAIKTETVQTHKTRFVPATYCTPL